MRIPYEQDQAIENYKKEHKIPKKTQTILILVKKGLSVEEIIKKKDHAHNLEIKKKDELVEMLRAGQSPKDVRTIVENACKGLGLKKNGEFYCMDKDAPISTEARRNFTLPVCDFCKAERRKEKDRSKTSNNSTTSKIYTKKPKILCTLSGRREDVLKILAKCEKCKLHEFGEYMKCRERYNNEQRNSHKHVNVTIRAQGSTKFEGADGYSELDYMYGTHQY